MDRVYWHAKKSVCLGRLASSDEKNVRQAEKKERSEEKKADTEAGVLLSGNHKF